MYSEIYGPRLLGLLDSIDQLPKEAADGDMYIVNERTKINVHGEMKDATISTAYICSSDTWLVLRKETFYEDADNGNESVKHGSNNRIEEL